MAKKRTPPTIEEEMTHLREIAIMCEGMECPRCLWPAAERLCAEDSRFRLGYARGPNGDFKRLHFEEDEAAERRQKAADKLSGHGLDAAAVGAVIESAPGILTILAELLGAVVSGGDC